MGISLREAQAMIDRACGHAGGVAIREYDQRDKGRL